MTRTIRFFKRYLRKHPIVVYPTKEALRYKLWSYNFPKNGKLIGISHGGYSIRVIPEGRKEASSYSPDFWTTEKTTPSSQGKDATGVGNDI